MRSLVRRIMAPPSGVLGSAVSQAVWSEGPFRAWGFLNQLAMGSYGDALAAFNAEWSPAPAEWRQRLLEMVLEDKENDEEKGWLMDERKGQLRPAELSG
jgi:hypothetical protein